MAPPSLNQFILPLLLGLTTPWLTLMTSGLAIAAPRPSTPAPRPSTPAPRPSTPVTQTTISSTSRWSGPNKVVSVIYLNETANRPTQIAVPPVQAGNSQLQPLAPIPIAVPQPAVAPTTAPPSASKWGAIASISAANIRPVQLWATYYYVHRAENIAGGQPLLNLNGERLGVSLSRKDWCYAAMQGTVQVVNAQGVPVTYNFAGRGSSAQVDCSAYFSSLSGSVINGVNRSRFEAVSASYGLGTGGYQLVPYRTIAVDRDRIPLGSVVYIPEARGTAITLPSGEQVVHDGYFFAADVGGAIRGNHIDVFLGVAERNPFQFVTSSPKGTFEAYVVNDPAIIAQLKALHKRQ